MSPSFVERFENGLQLVAKFFFGHLEKLGRLVQRSWQQQHMATLEVTLLADTVCLG